MCCIFSATACDRDSSRSASSTTQSNNSTPSPSTSTSPTPTPAPSDTTPESGEIDCTSMETLSLCHQVFCKINEQRTLFGISAYHYSPDLEKVAQNFATDMATHHYFSHTDLEGNSSSDRMTNAGISFNRSAENIAQGQTSSSSVMSSWMNSEGHRYNILNAALNNIGCGYNATYWVLDFTN
jgi:uncharacterized protein YkwD